MRCTILYLLETGQIDGKETGQIDGNKLHPLRGLEEWVWPVKKKKRKERKERGQFG